MYTIHECYCPEMKHYTVHVMFKNIIKDMLQCNHCNMLQRNHFSVFKLWLWSGVRCLTISDFDYLYGHLHKHTQKMCKSSFLPFVSVTFSAEHNLAFLARRHFVHLGVPGEKLGAVRHEMEIGRTLLQLAGKHSPASWKWINVSFQGGSLTWHNRKVLFS